LIERSETERSEAFGVVAFLVSACERFLARSHDQNAQPEA
jgi:hypothetical protein